MLTKFQSQKLKLARDEMIILKRSKILGYKCMDLNNVGQDVEQ
jgi:hypothetical protein